MLDRPPLSLRNGRSLRRDEDVEPPATDPSLTAVTPDEERRPPPVRTTLHPGVLLDGRYQLQRHISSRGLVQLWQGEDQVLARAVAIRLLIEDGQPEALEGSRQLIQAARRAGQLAHNGAASTYDATMTSADGLPLAYVVSEWVQGISLLGLLRDGPLLPERAAEIQLAVARVVAAAHAVGVSHGDLHPGDIVITSHGLIKVLDLEMRSALADASPAQQRARDVVGLGALLYASLTARWPLGSGRGLAAAERDGSGGCRPPRQLRAGVPRDLDTLTMALLAARTAPDGEPRPTAADIVAALESVVAELPTGAQPPLDDEPEADTPSRQLAKAAQAERVARASAARHRTIRRRALPIALLVILALAAWLVGVAVGRLPGHSNKAAANSGASGSSIGAPLKLAAVTDFDPSPGDGAEDPANVGLAYDGNPATAWGTEIYYGSQWGGIGKTGVGLKVDLGRPVVVSQVRLLFLQPGVSVQLRYAAADSASQDAYTLAANSPTSLGTEQTLRPANSGAHRYWLIWLTSLPLVNTPQGGSGYQGNLAEMTFFG